MTIAFNSLEAPRMVDRLRTGFAIADEIDISVSFVRYSGVQLIIDHLKQFLERGGRVRLLTSTFMGITQPEALRSLNQLNGLECRVQQSNIGYHPKMYLFIANTPQCWVGSSNLSKGGLASNIEANLMSKNPEIMLEAKKGFDTLWSRPDVFEVYDEWLDAYAEVFKNNIPRNILVSPPTSTVTTAPDHRSKPQPNRAQSEALKSLQDLRLRGEKKAVVIAAPGVGKTFLAAFDALAVNPSRILFISHRLEHLTQAQKTFKTVLSHNKTFGLLGAGYNQTAVDVLFTSIQSLNNRLHDIQSNGSFDYVIIDEFHHAAAKSYRRVIEELEPGFLLGLTATPERQDGHDILQLCDYNIAYEIRLVEAINRSWLLPFHYFGIGDDTVEWSQINWRGRGFDITQLEVALAVEERVDLIIRHALEKGYDGYRRATVGFCAGVHHAQYMSESFQKRGLKAAVLTGTDDLLTRQDTYKRFADPEDPLEWLFVADLLNEGVDIPAINSLLFLRPTDSATVFIQQLGRGLRLHEGSEVLTVLDFVGHHRNAWLTLNALEDRTASPNSSTVEKITPPTNCEIILDDLTMNILKKVKRYSGSKKSRCSEAYDRLKEEIGPPFPIDLLGRTDMPSFGDFRSGFGTWLKLRREKGDAEPWEMNIEDHSVVAQLLSACEKDWQQQRIYAYALMWGMIDSPQQVELGYDKFFNRFPKWRKEYKKLSDTKAKQTIQKKIGHLLDGESLKTEVFHRPSKDKLLNHIERRLQLTLEGDYKLRHGGVLRDPSDLRLHGRYTRSEIINHFGRQYDPAKHNFGVIKILDHIIIITKLDTSRAKAEFQYKNQIVNAHTLRWQSQNKQRQDNEAGKALTEHEQRKTQVHIFVQRKEATNAVYLGLSSVHSIRGNGPMTIEWKLKNQLSSKIANDLGINLST
jgi:superfamily II DNA or RNA helicase